MKQDKRWMLKVVRAIVVKLKERGPWTHLNIRKPRQAWITNSGGWSAIIGGFGYGRPRLEIWCDTFTRQHGRKFWYGFHSDNGEGLKDIIHRARKELPYVQQVTMKDVVDENKFILRKRLLLKDFHRPMLERYTDGQTLLGLYDQGQGTEPAGVGHLSDQVAAFLDILLGSPRNAHDRDGTDDVYPRWENRKRVVSHIRRERSSLLAAQRKARDKYICQVCTFSFATNYGILGEQFAEAHHRIALGKLDRRVQTKIEDLVTVCANCHRMLHHMKGHPGDILKLRTIVRKLRKR